MNIKNFLNAIIVVLLFIFGFIFLNESPQDASKQDPIKNRKPSSIYITKDDTKKDGYINTLSGYISKIHGTCYKISSINNEKILLKKDDKINEGDIITTSNKSYVSVIMDDLSIYSLGTQSEMKVVKYRENYKKTRNVLIDHVAGTMRTNVVKKNAPDGEMRIRTKTVSMGIRGTEFITSISPDSANVILFSGKIEIIEEATNKILKTITPKESVFIDSLFGTIELSSKFIEDEELNEVKSKSLNFDNNENFNLNFNGVYPKVQAEPIDDFPDKNIKQQVDPKKTNSFLNPTFSKPNLNNNYKDFYTKAGITATKQNLDSFSLSKKEIIEKKEQQYKVISDIINNMSHSIKMGTISITKPPIVTGTGSIATTGNRSTEKEQELKEKLLKLITKKEFLPLIDLSTKKIIGINEGDPIIGQFPIDSDGNYLGIVVDHYDDDLRLVFDDGSDIPIPAIMTNGIPEFLSQDNYSIIDITAVRGVPLYYLTQQAP